MVNEDRDAATHEEPVEAEPGSEDLDDLGGAALDDEESGDGTNLNPKAYKGLQRRLTAKDRELAKARQQVQELQSRAQSGDLSIDDVVRLVKPVIDTIKGDNPELARQLASNIAATIDARSNQSAQEKLRQYEQREQREKDEADTLSDLQQLAADLGADPADDGIDYGDPSMSLRERLALVRQTAKELSKPAKPTAPKPKQSTGDAVNDRAGTPPAPKGKAPQYTKADLDKALAAYTDTHKREHLVKAEEIKRALVAQAEAAFSR